MTDPSAHSQSANNSSSKAQGAKKATHTEETAHIYGRAGVVTFYTLLSRILGLVRDLAIAHRFGAARATDAWVQAFRIPNALRRLTAEGSMTIAFVPVYVEIKEKEGPEAAALFARRVMGLVLASTLAFAALGMVLSDWLVVIFSPGFMSDPQQFALTSQLILWSFPYLVMVSWVAWAMGWLNSEGRYAAPAAAPIFLNLGILAGLWGFSWVFSQPIVAVAAGVLAGGLAQMALQIPSLKGVGGLRLPLGGWGHPHLKKLYSLLIPSLAGVAVYQVNIIVLGVIASYLPTGQIFHYNNATRLTELVLGVFAFSFTTAGLPTLARHHARQDWERMAQTLRLTFSAVLYTILPAMAGLMGAGLAIVSVLYLHGEYGYGDVERTFGSLAMLALGMPAVALIRVMTPAFFALGDSRTPVKVSAATLLVTGLLGWQLSLLYEVEGLSLGLSLGTWFQCLLLGWVLRRKATHMKGWFPWRAVRVQGVSALAIGLGAWGVSLRGDWSQGPFWGLNLLWMGLAVAGGAAAYLFLTLAWKDEEAYNWVKLMGRLAVKLGLARR